MKTLPDISLPASMSRKQNFSVFNDYHRQCATTIINILLGKLTESKKKTFHALFKTISLMTFKIKNFILFSRVPFKIRKSA